MALPDSIIAVLVSERITLILFATVAFRISEI